MIFSRVTGHRSVEGQKVFAEVSYATPHGVFLAVIHNNTVVYGHMTRETAEELRNAIDAALSSNYWASEVR